MTVFGVVYGMKDLLAQFRLSGSALSCEPYGNGHIHQTFLVICDDGMQYVLQRVNTHVFCDPEALMHNIRLVCEHLKARSDSSREALTLVLTKDGATHLMRDGGCWRVYEAVRDSVCFDRAETPTHFAESARTFGRFFNRLSDFEAHLLAEPIPHFHDTPVRVEALKAAIRDDSAGRVRSAASEIATALSQAAFSHTFADLQAEGELPLRVTHNDTKINNVLFDATTLRGLCVVDLDTVMPGLIMNDFGDAIRFGASTAAEDEPDVERVGIDLVLYEAYLQGFLSACGGALMPLELALLPDGAKMMAYECGIRFLTDYLCGDNYFQIRYPEHNLVRARTQLKLVSDMDAKWPLMQRITRQATQAFRHG